MLWPETRRWHDVPYVLVIRSVLVHHGFCPKMNTMMRMRMSYHIALTCAHPSDVGRMYCLYALPYHQLKGIVQYCCMEQKFQLCTLQVAVYISSGSLQ
jgi:hypothetical protein